MPKENPVIAFLNKMADLILLNLIFLLCCIPVVTIGPTRCSSDLHCMQFHCDRYAMEMGMLYRLFSGRLSRILNSLLWWE